MIKAHPHNIWVKPEVGELQPCELSDEQLATFEAEIGLKLPQALVDLLKVQNGGSLRFELPDCLNFMIGGIGPGASGCLFRLDQEDHGYPDCPEHYPIHDLIAFDGDGHWYLCLDYRQNPAEPAVTYVDLEGDKLWEEMIAPSFQAYLEKLQLIVDDFYVIEPEWELEIILMLLEDSLETSFMAPDIWQDRPETRIAKFRFKGNLEWLYISPNLTTEPSSAQADLKSPKLSSSAAKGIKYPFLRTGSYLLEMAPEVKTRVLRSLESKGIEVRHLREYY